MTRHHCNSSRFRIRTDAFALVITLIMVVLAAIIVIALLSSAALDRTTSGSVSDRYQANLAAQNGLEAAKQALSYDGSGRDITRNDTFGIVRSALPAPASASAEDSVPHYYFIADYQAGNQVSYYPLFSGGQTQSNVTVTIPPLVTWTGTQAMATDGSANNYPLLFSTAPHSGWQKTGSSAPIHTSWITVPATPPANQPYYRYAYWIEDLRSYVDANVAGNTGSSGSHLRSLGYDPNEVALFSLFNPSLTADDGSTFAKTLVGNHSLLLTRKTTRLGTTANSADDNVCSASLVADLPIDFEQSVIPFGFGYKNQGQVKTNLNAIVKDNDNDSGVTQIVTAITDNLQSFASSRRGGLTDGYVETLAANIIDYADTDSTPLVGTNAKTGSHYRGIDLMPFAVEVYEMYFWDKDYYQPSPPAGDYYVDVRVRTYVELWNMFSKDITSGVFSFNDLDRAGIQCGTGGSLSSFDAVTPNDSKISSDFTKTPLKANEYRSVLACERVYTFDAGATVPAEKTLYIGQKGTPASDFDTNSSYEISWNGIPYDRPGALATKAIEHNKFTLTKAGTLQMIGTMPGLCYVHTAQGPPYNLGDPRADYYIQATQWDRAYVGDSSWGGQIYMKNLVQNSGWVDGESRVAGWADGGHNFTRGTTPTATPSSLAQNPTSISEQNPDGTKAPARISNDGVLHSITELSYIYDPFQWNPFTNNPTTTAAVDSGWQSTWKNKFNKSDVTYGSHSTLRIGRPEHKTFDQDGSRAWQLLDIFSAGDPTGDPLSNQMSTRGRININTASREALRALGAGIKIGNLNSSDVDQAIQPNSGIYEPRNTAAADVFADAVITQRQSHPFVSTSQLAGLAGSNGEPFFGNPDQWPSGAPTEWNDAASEEYFAKIFNFATVRSRNFRVFVTGQYVNPAQNDPNTGKPPRVIATANKVYEVFLKPTRDTTKTPAGSINSQACEVIYAADLPQ